MYRIAHISDLHLSADDKDAEKSFRSLLQEIAEKKCGHIIITGDLINQPMISNYEFVKQIFKDANIYSRDKLTILPGNHEIFGGADKKNGKGYLFPYVCKHLDYDMALSIFHESFKDILPENFEGAYPFLKVLHNNIVLAGFNSTMQWDSNLNPIGSNGQVNSIQNKIFANMSDELKKHKIKIALIHHHFHFEAPEYADEVHKEWLYSERFTMQLHNRNTVLNSFKAAEINCVLHGHTHFTDEYNIDGMTFYNSSGCFLPFTVDRKKYFYIFDFDDGPDFIAVKHYLNDEYGN
ncbi:MAG TPA: metallophosphoesterase [Ignavibacteria bacterium]|nr:metallophosphoesterase [Ignavibacteria bacterium]